MLEDGYKHKGMRKGLLQVLKKKGIRDEHVLKAVGKVPRHFFFETAFLAHAYEDKAFPIGEGQTISQPYTVARQTELLAPQPGHRVLEVGTGSGYQCCILLELGAKVVSIEYLPALHHRAQRMLTLMGYRGMTLVQGDGSRGYPVLAPYDRILVTAGAAHGARGLVDA
ncbi:protein-L-isoaspartate O-methyltransferase, partial [bacterium]|nr:protein-L-isoaspartate O-methyltransferase [bacterium]